MGLGGIQKRIRDIVSDMSDRYDDWEIYLLFRRKSGEGFDNAIKTKRNVFVRYYPFNGTIRPPLGFVYWITWQYMSLKPDIILTFLFELSVTIATLRRILFWIPAKIVLNEGVLTSEYLRIRHMLRYRPVVHWAYCQFDKIIVPTRACKNDLVENFSIPIEKICVIPNWTLFLPTSPLRPIYDIVYIGRFEHEKNPLFMVRLAKRLIHGHPRLRIGMIGNGSLRQPLVDAARKEKLQNNIQIIPFSSHINEIVRHSRILVVPSFNEGMPNVVLEAGMSCVPAVAAHFLGVEEVIIQGKTGYIYETDANAVEYIRKLLIGERQRRCMGKRAQEYVMEYFSYKTQRKFISTMLLGGSA